MNISIQREVLLSSLQLVTGVIEKVQSKPILSNLLMDVKGNTLTLIGSDGDIEIITTASLDSSDSDKLLTVPGKKLFDICNALPNESLINISIKDSEGSQAVVKSGRSRFNLSVMPAEDFPKLEIINEKIKFSTQQNALKNLLSKTQYAMGKQDVRHYLNGLLFEVDKDGIKSVATDGHRLAFAQEKFDISDLTETLQVIVPRKSITELSRIFSDEDQILEISLTENHVRFSFSNVILTSSLIDGQFPEYRRVIPKDVPKELRGDKDELRLAFTRAAILSNEKYRSVVLNIDADILQAKTNNPEREEAEEIVDVQFSAEAMQIAFNISYLIEALKHIEGDMVQLNLKDSDSSCLIHEAENLDVLHVIMPVRI
jgi:DNA polymerase III subunit beta